MKLKIRFFVSLGLTTWLLLSSLCAQAVTTEAGVSKALADYRAAHISDIHYQGKNWR